MHYIADKKDAVRVVNIAVLFIVFFPVNMYMKVYTLSEEYLKFSANYSMSCEIKHLPNLTVFSNMFIREHVGTIELSSFSHNIRQM